MILIKFFFLIVFFRYMGNLWWSSNRRVKKKNEFDIFITLQISEEIITLAYESGINFFDTAEVYAAGK
ncbi:hypothetical protein KUTeg_002107 [Tegillarca granosa]|uniref:NADP-dependent oxidoreductase domain-containing protein n=1 Tax=Tegillarca granosa TaxID=220873 RepID=A0ABQ9FXQ7_TEGGR|nr:hypothetical protein KUTeg_002107 [Tegillarca granosa]